MYDVNWMDVIEFDFEKAFSIMRGLKIPMCAFPLLHIEEKIPDTLKELQEHFAYCLKETIININQLAQSRDHDVGEWRYGPFVFQFVSRLNSLTVYFAPIIVDMNIKQTGEE